MKIKSILIGLFFVGLIGCASSSKEAYHHHNIAYKGKCAYSVAHGKHDVSGKKEFNVIYKGKTYYFSNSDLRDHFVKEIESNITTANMQWAREIRSER